MQGNVIPVEGSWALRLLWTKVEVRIGVRYTMDRFFGTLWERVT